MSHMKRTAAAVAVLTLSVTACGGDDDDEAGDTQITEDTESVVEATEALGGSATTPETTEASITTDRPTTTTAAPTTTKAHTTTMTDPQQQAIDQFADYQGVGSRDGLALFAPLSPAYIYYEAIVILSQHGEQTSPPQVIPVEGGFKVGSVTLDSFVFDEAGLITDLSRNGIPLSQVVVGLGYTAQAGDITGLIHSARLFDNVLQVVMQTTNNSAEDSSFYVDSYVPPDGRQLQAFPTSSLSNTVRPGATVAYIYGVEGASFGGTLYGMLGGGTDNFVYQDVELLVPAPTP